MFQQLITNLAYSPSVLTQVSFYARRLSQEEFTRRIGVIFLVLAVFLQGLILFRPPENAVQASPYNDVITGGITPFNAKKEQAQEFVIDQMQANPAVRAVYKEFGITAEDIRNTRIQTIDGRDESYFSVGRQASGQTPETEHTRNGYTFYDRPLNKVLRDPGEPVKVLVGLRADLVGDENPWFAIMFSCGNPVIQKGQDAEVEVTKARKQTTVAPGGEVTYQITYRNTSNNPAYSPVIQDDLPPYTTYKDHFPKDFFNKVDTSKPGVVELRSSKRPANNALGGKSRGTINLVLSVSPDAPNKTQLCNKAQLVSLSDSDQSERACIRVVVPPQSTARCTSLRLNPITSRETRSFTATGVAANGATISAFEFDINGDGIAEQTIPAKGDQASMSHTFADPGTYNVRATAITSLGAATSPSCVQTVTIAEPVQPAEIVVICQALRWIVPDSSTDLTHEFEASAVVEYTEITAFLFDFDGDGIVDETVQTSEPTATVQHTYSQPGTYLATVQVATSDQLVSGPACQQTVLIEEVELEPEEPVLISVCRPAATGYELISITEAERKPGDQAPINGACPKPTPPAEDPNEPPTETPDPELAPPNLFKRVANLTQNITDANNTTAKAGDMLGYTLIIDNPNDQPINNYHVSENLADVLQYADLTDLNGGSFDETSQTLSWRNQTIQANSELRLTFEITIFTTIPSTPTGASDGTQFDLQLTNVFGNSTTVNVAAPMAKRVEGAVTALPNTGGGSGMAVAVLAVFSGSFFYFRSRQLRQEIHAIRQEIAGSPLTGGV